MIFREDLVSRMRRNCIVPPDENTEPDVSKHVNFENKNIFFFSVIFVKYS